jgi:hypothetical protein
MTKNFQTQIKNNSNNGISISLFGNFDGASAYELANIVKENIDKTKQIQIYTDGLKDIYHFGLGVFNSQIKKFCPPTISIEFKGRYKENFTE